MEYGFLMIKNNRETTIHFFILFLLMTRLPFTGQRNNLNFE